MRLGHPDGPDRIRTNGWSVPRPSRYVPAFCVLSQEFALESAQMTADTSGATDDYSSAPGAATSSRDRARSAVPSVLALRGLLTLMGLAGAVLLVLSTFITVAEIRVLTTSELVSQDTRISGGELHGIALVLVALFAVVMLAGTWRGAQPAMLALAATGLLALGLIVGLDVPELDNTGQVAQFYEDVSAGAASGFYLETLGAVLLLLAGGGLFLLSTEAVSDRVQAVGRGLGAGASSVGGSVRAGASRSRDEAGRRLAERRARGMGAEPPDEPR